MSTLLEPIFIFETNGIFYHKLGKSVTKPKINIIPPDMYFQKSCGMFTNKVLTFKMRVNKITEIPRDITITNILLLLIVESETDLPTITGKSGNMHGARIVSTPAI